MTQETKFKCNICGREPKGDNKIYGWSIDDMHNQCQELKMHTYDDINAWDDHICLECLGAFWAHYKAFFMTDTAEIEPCTTLFGFSAGGDQDFIKRIHCDQADEAEKIKREVGAEISSLRHRLSEIVKELGYGPDSEETRD